MTQDDVKDPSETPEPAERPGEAAPASPAAPAAAGAPPPAPGGSTPATPQPEPAFPTSAAEIPPPVAPAEAPASAVPAAEPSAPDAPTPVPEALPEPVDEISMWVRVGQVGSGRRLSPPDPALRDAIRGFASQRQLPGVGTLIDLARAHADSDRGPTLGVDAFTEIRSQLGRLVEELEAVAIQVGPVLFLKTSAKNQPGTALRWLHADERAVLREHPELLDHPGRLVANLRKRTSGEE